MNSMNKNKLTNLNVDNLNVNFTLEIKYLIMLKYIFIVKFKFGHGTKEYIPNELDELKTLLLKRSPGILRKFE